MNRKPTIGLLGLVFATIGVTAFASIAAASLTFTGTGVTGDGAVVIDSSSTISIGTSSATGITIGNPSSTVSFPGNVTVGSTVLVVQTPLSAQAPPTVTQVGTAGSTEYDYAVSACNQVGCANASITAFMTGNATLDSSNYNVVSTHADPRSTYCLVWRNGFQPLGSITCGGSINDQGQNPSGFDLDNGPNSGYPPAGNTSNGATSQYLALGNSAWSTGAAGAPLAPFQIGVNDSGSIGQQAFNIESDFTPSVTSPRNNYAGTILAYAGGPSNIVGITGLGVYALPSSDSAQHLQDAVGVQPEVDQTCNGCLTDLAQGVQSNINISGGTATKAISVAGYAGSLGGTIGTAIGVQGNVENHGGTIGTAIAINALSPVGAATNVYGLNIEDQTGGTSGNWAIKTGLGKSEFGDVVQFDAAAGSQPTCDSAHRFELWTVAGGTGVKDSIQMCAKDEADAYAWRTVY